MPELTAILGATRDKEYTQQRFAASLKGIDLDIERGSSKLKEMQAKVSDMSPEEAKARLDGVQPSKVDKDAVMNDPNDILTQKGLAARQTGFGIGMGIEAEKIDVEGNVTKL